MKLIHAKLLLQQSVPLFAVLTDQQNEEMKLSVMALDDQFIQIEGISSNQPVLHGATMLTDVEALRISGLNLRLQVDGDPILMLLETGMSEQKLSDTMMQYAVAT